MKETGLLQENKTKRLAKNTLVLYLRQIFILLISLYTVRVVLNVLGAQDYGIYNVIAGVVVLFSFVNNALASSTQRYLNFYLGKNDLERTKDIYSASIVIYSAIALIFILLAETAGLWFVLNKLNIPQERHEIAMIVYHLAVITTAINIFKVPYHAVVIAYEKMSFFAYVSIFEAVLKLAVVFLLKTGPFDKLLMYSILLTLSALLVFFIYKVFCNTKIEIASFNKKIDKPLIKEIVNYCRWNLLAAIAVVGRNQGANIILNMFTNVTVNAAMGIANQVNSAVYSFVTSFQTAFNPQLVKSYSSGEKDYFHKLLIRSSKFSFFLLFVLVLPLFLNAEFILTVWLKNVPDYTVVFVRLILIWSLIESLSGPLFTAVQANGDIKSYQIILGTINLLNVPLTIIAFLLKASPLWVLYIRILLNVIAMIFRIVLCQKKVNLNIPEYLKKVILKAVMVVMISVPSVWFIGKFFNSTAYFFVTCISSVIINGLAIFFLGLEKEERKGIGKGFNEKSVLLKNKNFS